MKTWFVAGLMAIWFCEAAAQEKATIVVEEPLAVRMTTACVFTNAQGKTLGYRWHAPAQVEEGRKYPLVILLHGAGERGTNNVAQLKWGANELLGFMREKKIEGFFVAAQVPEGKLWVDTPWNGMSHRMNAAPSETMGLMLELLDKILAEEPVDRAAIRVTGVSMGGFGTWDMVQRRPGLFSKAMPVCGGGDTHLAWKIRTVPIWAWHGAEDRTVFTSRSREMTSALWAVDGNIRYTEVPGRGHDVWLDAYADTKALEWFFNFRAK